MTCPSKECFRCGEIKPLTDFYKHPAMKDGRVGKCKECNRKDNTRNRNLNLNHYREYDKMRPSRNKHVSLWESTHPERKEAHARVNNALRNGELLKEPCFICGAAYVHGHHNDYTKPLDVVWLCPRHHAKVHQDCMCL